MTKRDSRYNQAVAYRNARARETASDSTANHSLRYRRRRLRIVDGEGFISYADNRYSVPWRLIGQMLPIRVMEDQLQIYNASVELV
ncbi:MAG: hypothetical protein R3C53_16210 [Pirellulaceae bacterium]